MEVTESAAIRSFDRARATISSLRQAGVKVYLDDFGEGHSSIRYLREFGVDAVKLDRAYVRQITESESAYSLVAGFVQLAHGIGLSALIEGVETPEQLQLLSQAGADLAQGFHIGKPMDIESLGECFVKVGVPSR